MTSNKLLKALDDDSNEFLFNYTSKTLMEMILSILKQLELPKSETLELLKKLKGYKFVDEMNDLKYGTYLRWISLVDPENIGLNRGALFCEIKITDDGVYIVCKGFGVYPKYFQIKMDECLLFQKLTEQEQILLQAIDHVTPGRK
jgi:hypothetical protein